MTLQDRLAAVRERIARAASRAGRDPSSVRLVAVSKTFGPDAVRAAAAAGQRDFGENKVQEALQKIDHTSDLALRWHLIGHLQSNKAKRAASRFDAIHSIDGSGIAEKVEQAAAEAGRRIDLLVQVDLAGEPTKHGAREDELLNIFECARSWTACRLRGLMLLPPAVDDPDEARPYFCALRAVRGRLLDQGVDGAMLAELSMGMSHDFEAAVEEGATIVRVGSAIFGPRSRI